MLSTDPTELTGTSINNHWFNSSPLKFMIVGRRDDFLLGNLVTYQGRFLLNFGGGGGVLYCFQNPSGQIIIFHQPRFPWNKGNSLTKPPFGVRSCEVAIIWPESIKIHKQTFILKEFGSDTIDKSEFQLYSWYGEYPNFYRISKHVTCTTGGSGILNQQQYQWLCSSHCILHVRDECTFT